MQLLYRKHEGVTLLCQNNDERIVRIFGANEVMQKLLGCDEAAIKGKPLQAILAEDSAGQIDDYLEYEHDANDVGQVIGKMRRLRFKGSEGQDVPVEAFKIVRIEAKDRHQWFRLIVEDTVHKREIEAFKRSLSENFKGHEVIDEESGLPDAASIAKNLELSQHFVGSKRLHACFAYVRINDFPGISARYGRAVAIQALGHAATILRRNLRMDDALGRVAEDALGMILMDIEPDSARVVMNRLRWLIQSEALPVGSMKEKHVAVAVGFSAIENSGATELPARCAEAVAADGSGFSQVSSA